MRVRPTDDLELQRLVLPHSITETSTFVLFTTEVLDGLVIQQAVSMDTASDLQLEISNGMEVLI